MRRFNVIVFLKKNINRESREVLNKFIKELETTLIYVDKFEHSLYFDIYEFIYIFDYEINQYEIADELGISQSKVSKKLKKIDEYICELLQEEEYNTLSKIFNPKTMHKS